jgi:hypothetical protein
MEMQIDHEALREALITKSEECRRLKKRLRRTWVEPMADVQRAHVRARRRMTELCVLRAFTRGRRHLKKPLREGAFPGMEWDSERYHQSVAARVAQDFPVGER